MKKLVIIGDGDQSRIIQNILLHSKEFKLCYFIKLSKSKRTKDKLMPKVNKINLDQFLLKKKTNYYFICSIANNYSRFSFVKMFDQKFKNIKWAKLISKFSKVSKYTKIGAGSVICDNTFIGPETIIGNHCFINNNSKIEHHNHFDDYTSVGPAVKTGGNVILKKFSYIGLNAVIKNNIEVKENTVVGANSLILKNCKKNSTYFGNPAKFQFNRSLKRKYI
jgi:sugar O-acyltransferase (sialic acid O-acetyltransferase NeuD family)